MIYKQCLECGKEFKTYPYMVKQGYGKFCNMSCRSKYRSKQPEFMLQAQLWQRKGRELTGESAGGWRGGVSTENEKARKSVEFAEWRNAVFTRDNWTCRKCNENKRDLHPHHIKAFATYPELRFVVSNGLTLCEYCHKQEHKLIQSGAYEYDGSEVSLLMWAKHNNKTVEEARALFYN